MSPLLAVEDLSVSFTRGGLLNRLVNPFPLPGFNVIDGVTLSLMPGETLGLVGESGSGKTTLARAILGLIRAAAGRIVFEGRDVATPADFRAMRRRSAMMFQDPVASLSPRLRIGTLLTEPQIIQGVAMPDRRAAAKALLALVGLPSSFVDAYPHELSGGHAQARRPGPRAGDSTLRPAVCWTSRPPASIRLAPPLSIPWCATCSRRWACRRTSPASCQDSRVHRQRCAAVLVMREKALDWQGMFSAPMHPSHGDAHPVRADPRSAPAQPEPRRHRRNPERVPAALGLRVPHALPDRARSLQDRGAGLSADGRRPHGALPFPAGFRRARTGSLLTRFRKPKGKLT